MDVVKVEEKEGGESTIETEKESAESLKENAPKEDESATVTLDTERPGSKLSRIEEEPEVEKPTG